MGPTLTLKVPRRYVKTVKTILESSDSFTQPFHFEHDNANNATWIIAVCKATSVDNRLIASGHEEKLAILHGLNIDSLNDFVDEVDLAIGTTDGQDTSQPEATLNATRPNSPGSVISSWLYAIEAGGLIAAEDRIVLTESANAARYQIYHPMLLFSAGAFETRPWRDVLGTVPETHRDGLFERIANVMAVTHVAVNAPIPRETGSAKGEENCVRSPSNLKPLYGDFGPLVQSSPTPADFGDAFWVRTTQNDIVQTWAPRYTMFSRGNVTEKTRVLRLPTVADAITHGRATGKGSAAVDLYAGIGYFTFSYAKAGVEKVLCFEINPWSVEGLRRGAEGNKWDVSVVKDERDAIPAVRQALARSNVRLLAFQMSNEHAGTVVKHLRDALPPVRHVNCGLLPNSAGSWATAISVLDPEHGGWLHLHENLPVTAIAEGTAAVLKTINTLAQDIRPRSSQSAVLEHAQRVKTYAPGVMHCVLDIYFPPVEI